MNETTELIMKQLNAKKVHAETHELGGGDEIDVTKLKNVESLETVDHSAKHELGGSDEINVMNLRNVDNLVTKTGDFSGTWNGITMTSTDPGLSSAFTALKADVATASISSYPRIAPEVDDTARIQRAIAYVNSLGGGIVLVPKGEFTLNPAVQLAIYSNVSLIGSGNTTTLIKGTANKTKRMIKLFGSNILISGIGFDGNEPIAETYMLSFSILEVNTSCENITITNCAFKNGFAGVWLNPNPTLDTLIKNVIIKNNIFESLEHSIYIGATTSSQVDRNDSVCNVLIDGNIIKDGRYESDGIKTVQRCHEIVIVNNFISNQRRDGIDLFTSGDNVIVKGNVITNNTKCGIDIKFNTDLCPPQFFGNNQRMNITNNIIDYNGFSGISIAQEELSVLDNYLIVINGNSFTGNAQDGVALNGNYTNVTNNMFYNNGTSTADIYAAIRIQPRYNRGLKGLTITNNIAINNGTATQGGYGILLNSGTGTNSISDSVINDNIIINDASLNSPNQNVGLFFGALCRNVTVRGNKVKGHTRNVWIKNGAEILGQSLYIPIGDIPKSDYTKNFVGISPLSKISIIDARFMNTSAITAQSGSDGYLVFQLFKVVNGVLSSSLAGSNTTITGVSAYVPRVVNVFNHTDINIDNNLLNPGEVILFQLIGANTGRAITNANVEIRYIEH